MSLYLRLALIAVFLASYAGVFYVGSEYGTDRQLARAASTQEIADEAASKAIGDGSKLLSAMTITNKTIYQKATREVQTNTVYADCRHSDSMLGTINQALTGRGGGAAGAAGAGVPGAVAAERPVVRSDNAQAGGYSQPVPSLSVRGAAVQK